MFKRILVIAMLIIVGATTMQAQTARLKRAQTYMDQLDYVGAIELYNQILATQDNSEAKINIAECYRKVSDSENAEYWYGQVVRLPEAQPIHYLYYGQALQRNGKCDLAKEWYVKFVDAAPDDLRGQYLEKACDYEEELMTKNAGIYEIKHLEINSNLDDHAPTYYGDGIIFASERDKGTAVERTHSWTGNPFLELYFVEAKESGDGEAEGVCGNFTYGRADKFSKKVNTKFHENTVAFNSDQTEMFFTSNNQTGKDDEGIKKLKIYSAKGSGNSWSGEEGLPFNSDEYSICHPTLTNNDNSMYFSSDMPGGFGGMDLYRSDRENGRWGPPINLGPQINTEGNEVFPYYGQNERLYFSSDGHVGLGGLDIYYMDDKGNGEWGNIENIGYPVNTISDDFSIIFNEEGTCGYFSSDRSGGAGNDDIYSFKKIAVPVELLVIDEVTGEPIEGAMVVDECTGASYETNAEGKAMVDMRINECCTFTASMEEYLDNDKEGCTTSDMSQTMIVEIPLKKEMVFDMEGYAYDENNLPLELVDVTLTNDCGDEEQVATTDSEGRFYFELKDDCCYTITGVYEGYEDVILEGQCTRDLSESTTLKPTLTFARPNSFVDKGGDFNPGVSVYDGSGERPTEGVYYDSDLEEYVDAETGLPANGTYDGVTYENGQIIGGDSFQPGPINGGGPIAYLLHIYYDFDQSYLRDEASTELEKLLSLMNEREDYVVEIGSHTDARGSNRYNDRLSQRRAESVVRWLEDNGIERDRLVAKGYGETMNVNSCTNNIPCSEEQHQLNRRTEFRVLSCATCDDIREVSQPKANPRIDPCQGCPF